jgi:hypothetical protein
VRPGKRKEFVMRGIRITPAFLSLIVSIRLPALAQQVTGTPGSPSATTAIGGQQIPPPPVFRGKIEHNAAQRSTGSP